MTSLPYRKQVEGLALPVDRSFGATVDGSAEAFWLRLLAHPLVRASDRRSPYPPPPKGPPLLATREGDTITVRYWRPRMTVESVRLELRTGKAVAEGRTRIEGLLRSRATGIPTWTNRDERIEDVATVLAYGVATLVVGGLAAFFLGSLLALILIAPVAILVNLLPQLLIEGASRAADRGSPSRRKLRAAPNTELVTAPPTPRWGRARAEDQFERLLSDLGVIDLGSDRALTS